MYRASDRAGLEIPDDVRDAFGEDKEFPPVEPVLEIFEQLCQTYDRSGWLYLMYRSLSGFVHPSSAAAVLYSDRCTDPPGLLLGADHGVRPLMFTLTLATALVVAVQDDLVRTKPNKTKIRDTATKVGVASVLTVEEKARKVDAEDGPRDRKAR